MSILRSRPMTEGMKMRIQATYHLRGREDAARRQAEEIALEQSVELPREALPDAATLMETTVGRVEALVSAKGGEGYLATLSYDQKLGDGQLPQLLNLLFGNISMLPGVRLVDLELPDTLVARFTGPKFGLDGLRSALGVHDRPLLATALKPRGAPLDVLTGIAHDFARAGGDLVKDDHTLGDDFERFKTRVEACAEAVQRGNQAGGGHCRYFPHIIGPLNELERRLEFVLLNGLEGVLICPMIVGLETTRSLSDRYPLVMMAHPALTGGFTVDPNHGIAQDLLLGTLFRLCGADISIFPNVGGRFPVTLDECLAIQTRLREPLGSLAPAWPSPAGGMGFDRLAEMGEAYGENAILLIGGSLLHGDSDLVERTGRYMERIVELFPDSRSTAPERGAIQPDGEAFTHLAFREGFEWEDRVSTPYKDSRDLAFKGVRRVELIGKHGERTQCSLRYFEVAPGGFTSFEKHLHTHIVIGARGVGTLRRGEERHALNEMDIAYIGPLESHQLSNDTDQPFGFYCIVDQERDRPAKA